MKKDTDNISKTAERKKRLLRSIEYKKLKRIRKKTVPGYRFCKNCGCELKGMYCHQCGQYALDTEQPFWKYILQYFENVYQFDGKVWTTLRMLLLRPGFLTNEFNAGKIVSYVHPMRLLMFITVIFFLFFFIFINKKIDTMMSTGTRSINETLAFNELISNGITLDNTYSKDTVVVMVSDSAVIANYQKVFGIINCISDRKNSASKDTLTVRVPKELLSKKIYNVIGKWNGMPLIEFNYKYTSNTMTKITIFKEHIIGIISKYAPLVTLLLIPLFALILKGMYRKYMLSYMGNFVFSLHLASFFFMLLSCYIIIGELWKYGGIVILLFTASVFIYTVIASYKVYKGSGWIKTTIKSFTVLLIYTFIVLIIISSIFIYLIYTKEDIFIDIYEEIASDRNSLLDF